jgi:hypothetical protein
MSWRWWLVAFAVAPSVVCLPVVSLMLRYVGDPDLHLTCYAAMGLVLFGWGVILGRRLHRPGWLALAAVAALLLLVAAATLFGALGILGHGACEAGAVIAGVGAIVLALLADLAVFSLQVIAAQTRSGGRRSDDVPR